MSDVSDIAERTERALKRYGIDLCEYFLLDTARLESPAPPHQFASFAKNLCDGDSRGQFTMEEYQAGLERLMAKGLLCLVTPAEIEAESARNREAGIPELRVRNYYGGTNIDFTQKGFDVNQNVVLEIWGARGLDRKWTGWKIDSTAQRVDVYGLTADDCQGTIDRFLNRDRPMFGKSDLRYAVSQGPSPIGAWSPKRFVTLPSGFHGVLTYAAHTSPAGPRPL